MKTNEEILEYIDKEYKEDKESVNARAKEMARQYLEHCDGDYDAARIMAQATVMVCKLTYELLTKIQTAIEREDLNL